MKPYLNKFASAAAAGIVIVIGCAMAGLGLTVVVFLAMVALAAFALAFVASPFLAWAAPQAEEQDNDVVPGTPSTAE